MARIAKNDSDNRCAIKGLAQGLALSALLFVAALVMPDHARADAFAEGARMFVGQMTKDVTASLTDGSVPRPERVERMRDLLDRYFAVKAIGQWVLGRHWRRADESQRTEYLELFENLIIYTYVDRFTEYEGDGEALKVSGSTDLKAGKEVMVHTAFQGGKGEPVVVDWRVKARGESYGIVDVMVAGISMGQTQRSDFNSAIRKNGGQVPAFLADLRSLVEKAKNAKNDPQTAQP
ncbi:MAG: MlaC/ttg2D family ABC transporter substrate-binding protein [Magnetovibrionaceae bacterium]